VASVDPNAASQRCLELRARSRLAGQLAERALRPAEPLAYGRADAVACELYREAVYWALLAHRELDPSERRVADGEGPAPASRDLLSLWDAADPALLASAAGGSAAVERLRAELAGHSFAEFAELAPGRQTQLAESLRAFNERLLEPLDTRQVQVERTWTVRVVRLVTIALGLLLFALIVQQLRLWQDRRRDLAVQATWTTSSTYPLGGCVSPQQRCPASPNYFFHTESEQNPWLLFDLGSEKTLSAVWVENRVDCCSERAQPLVVSVSTDKKTWTEVTRRETTFDTWLERFPRVKARWVKFSVPRQTALHLASVRLVP
jgi:hypothetical protein